MLDLVSVDGERGKLPSGTSCRCAAPQRPLPSRSVPVPALTQLGRVLSQQGSSSSCLQPRRDPQAVPPAAKRHRQKTGPIGEQGAGLPVRGGCAKPVPPPLRWGHRVLPARFGKELSCVS